MADLRPNRLAAELRDLLAELDDDLYDTLEELAGEAMGAAQDADKTPAGKAMLAVWFGISDRAISHLDRTTAHLRAIIVRLECPPERIAERLEGGGR